MQEAELSLLGCCMANRNAFGIAQDEGVTSASFEGPAGQAIWSAMERATLDLHAEGMLDPVVVCSALGPELDTAGGRSFIHSLVSAVPATTNTRQYAKAVGDAHLLRSVRKILQEALDGTKQLKGQDALDMVQAALFRLENPEKDGMNLTEALMWVSQQTEPSEATCTWPWRHIDYLTRGLRPGWMCILAARTSYGKTCGALQISLHNLQAGRRVLYLTREMLPYELGIRIAISMGVDSDNIYGGSVSDRDRSRLIEATEGFDPGLMRIESMDAPERLPAVLRRHKPDLVIVDYLQLLDLPKGITNRVEGTARNSHLLKGLAQRFEVPILVLSQFSRQHRDDRGKTPSLEDLKDSSAVEQDADQIIFIHRTVNTNTNMPNPEGELVVAKARNGRTGKIAVMFDSDGQKFYEV